MHSITISLLYFCLILSDQGHLRVVGLLSNIIIHNLSLVLLSNVTVARTIFKLVKQNDVGIYSRSAIHF